ncbi:MAG TPA: DMT family transporter [Candidatus Polarisedimenticolia bacterium]|nr:DMT family transporter [Candidatus Polarisedimenticolia bacterium]
MLRPHALLWTPIALVAFATNSWLCRYALRDGAIDAASFTALRLLSGALLLVPLARTLEPATGSRRTLVRPAAAALFGYAIAFSLAYLSLDTGVGALIAFGAVQTTMIGVGLATGERPGARQWVGLLLATGGLVYLVAPGVSAPAPVGAALMAVAGISWGVYSLLGRGESRPIAATAANFAGASVAGILCPAVATLLGAPLHVTPRGALLAVASGALTSGLGYVAWYAALRSLSATTAAIVQLATPVLVAIGGVLFLGEHPGTRLAPASLLILGGIALAVVAGPRAAGASRGSTPGTGRPGR